MHDITRFLKLLRDSPTGNVFNPWYEQDPEHDQNPHAPAQRTENLHAYLTHRLHHARWIFIAEAIGFRGGKFSGIPMTCERQLPQTQLPHHRTSSLSIPLNNTDQRCGILEPTAMIVARAMLLARIDPKEVVLWNSFAWHPHQPARRLTNRTPAPAEMIPSIPVLQAILGLFPRASIIAIGKTCQRTLGDLLGVSIPSVRHPANGGATEFTQSICKIARARRP